MIWCRFYIWVWNRVCRTTYTLFRSVHPLFSLPPFLDSLPLPGRSTTSEMFPDGSGELVFVDGLGILMLTSASLCFLMCLKPSVVLAWLLRAPPAVTATREPWDATLRHEDLLRSADDSAEEMLPFLPNLLDFSSGPSVWCLLPWLLFLHELGPKSDRRTGKRKSPWRAPSTMTKNTILKKVTNM